MKKILYFTFLIACFICLSGQICFAEETTVWNGLAASGFESGTGTAEDPYVIVSAEQLAFFAQSVNSGTTYANQYISLGTDIILNDTSNYEKWDSSAPSNVWTPIGNDSRYFSGEFDGNGHKIKGVYINTTTNKQGLFGETRNAKIKNLGVVESYIKGEQYVGGIVGYSYNPNKGTINISNCYNKGIINGSFIVGGVVGDCFIGNIDRCFNSGKITCSGNYVGGIVGNAAATNISNSDNDGIVNGKKNYIGGIAGDNQSGGIVTYCKNTGSVIGSNGEDIGGIVGKSDNGGVVKFCYNTGTVSGNRYVGGIVGYNFASSDDTTMIQYCYNKGKVWGTYDTGGIVGYNLSYSSTSVPAVYDCYNAGVISGYWYIGGIAGSHNVGYGSRGGEIISRCYNVGTVSGSAKVGGIVGFHGDYSTVSNCYYLDTSCGSDDYGVALDDTQMKSNASFVGFDFSNTWTLQGNPQYDYPEFCEMYYDEYMKTITFIAAGGIGTMTEQTVEQNTSVDLNQNTFTRDGYIFYGWATVDSNGEVVYTNGQTITVTDNITLYAVWHTHSYMWAYEGYNHFKKCECGEIEAGTMSTHAFDNCTDLICNCGYERTLGHKLSKTEAKTESCTIDGNNAYWTCLECGNIYADDKATIITTVEQQTIRAGHKYIDGVCSSCGDVIETYIVSYNASSKSAIVTVKETGKYTLIFAKYNTKNALSDIDVVEFDFKKGKNNVPQEITTFALSTGDKVMLRNSMTGLTPIAEVFIIK